jgi:hypothetical protein
MVSKAGRAEIGFFFAHAECRKHHSARNVLRTEQVLDIFKRKIWNHEESTEGKGLHNPPDATKVGKEIGVTPKTVRDIWTGRRETLQLDPSRPDARERLSKQVGRPQGSKDRKPRRQRELASAADIQEFDSPIPEDSSATSNFHKA